MYCDSVFLTDRIMEGEQKLIALQTEYKLSQAATDDIIRFARWLQAKTAMECGMSATDVLKGTGVPSLNWSGKRLSRAKHETFTTMVSGLGCDYCYIMLHRACVMFNRIVGIQAAVC